MSDRKTIGESQKRPAGGVGERLGKGLGAAVTPPTPQASQTPPTPAAPAGGPGAAEQERETLSARASSLGGRINTVRSSATLGDLRGSLGRLDSTLTALPAALEEVRRGGYLYKSFLEKKVEVLREQWQGLRQRVDAEAAQQGQYLTREADALQQRLSTMGARLNAPALDTLERDIAALEGKVRDAARALEGTFDTIEGNARQTEQQIKGIKMLLERIAAATFRLREAEAPIEVVGAQYLTDGQKEGPKGFLFVTNHRLLFEQNESVATKKFLFITTASEHIQKLVLEAPVGGIEQARASERGGLARKEILDLTFRGADVQQATFQLQADSAAWAALLGRVRDGDIEGERLGVEKEVAAVQATPANVPTNCPTCGASLPELMRGQTSLRCDYCRTVVRV